MGRLRIWVGQGAVVEVGKETGGGVGEEIGHRAAVELGMERRQVRVKQEAGRDGGGGAFGQVCGVREETAWMGKLWIWVGQGSVAELGKLAGGGVREGSYR